MIADILSNGLVNVYAPGVAETLTVLMCVSVLTGIFLGFPIAFTLMGIAFIYGFIGVGNTVVILMGYQIGQINSDVAFITVPLFVFMGCMLERAGIADGALGALSQWLRKVRGGFGIAIVIICLLFAGCIGIVGASVAALGTLALAPMIKNGYSKSLSTGLLAAGGTLGILLPPNVALIIYSPIIMVSMAKLFMGAVFPGLLLGFLYALYVGVIGYFKKGEVPEVVKDEEYPIKYTLGQGLIAFVPFVFLIFIVLGAIFFGIVPPGDAAAIGALGSIIVAIANRKCNKETIMGAALNTLRITTMVIFVALGAHMFSSVFFILGCTRVINRTLSDLGLGAVGSLALFLIVVFVAGIFIDWLGVILIFTPIFIPLLTGLGWDPLHIGIVVMVMLQTSFLTPPFAYSIFYVLGIAPPGVTIGDIYRGVIPFICIQIVVVMICLFFPPIITYLPNLMFTGFN